jgi:hypothetical protein
MAAFLQMVPGSSPRRRIDFIVGLVLTLLLLSIYMYFFHNRFLPITEGWFQYYSSLMFRGQVPYRDFQVFVPPWVPIQLTVVNALLGNQFINARILGTVERLILAGCLYFWLTRFFSVKISFISALTCIFFLGSNNADLPYSYWQTHLTFAIATGVLVSLAFSTVPGRRQLSCLFAAGVSAGLAFMTKQTALMFFVLPVLFMLVLSTDRFRGTVQIARSGVLVFAAGWAAVVLAIALWLTVNGALIPFIGQVFGGVSSKGPLTSIVFGFLTRAFPRRDVAWFLRLALLGLPLVALAKRPADSRGAPRWLRSDTGWTLLLGVAMAACVVVPYLSIPFSNSLKIIYAQIRFVLVGNVFYSAVVLGLIYFIRLFMRNPDQEDVQFGLLVLFSLAVMLEVGLAGFLNECGVVPGMAFALAIILRSLRGSVYAGVLRMVAYAGAVSLIALCVAAKYVEPYEWWGCKEPDVRTATVAPSQPLLRGLRVSPNTNAVISEINDIILANSSPSDYIFAFPHMPLFYLLSSRKTPTFSSVHYFDVCPDACAIQDAQRLLAHPPAVIINLEFPERAWKFHEVTFRGGKPSGQRRIIEAIGQLVQTYHYRLAEEYHNRPGFPIQVWVRPQAEK